MFRRTAKAANPEDCAMSKSNQADVSHALRIVGAEDFSDDGQSGVVTVSGDFASAIMGQLASDPEARRRMGLDDQPVRISRMGGLEICCNGFDIEGRGVRAVVHRAARSVMNCARLSTGTLKPGDACPH